MDFLMVFFTRLGEFGCVWLALAVIFLVLRKARSMGFAVVLAIAVESVLCNLILKPAFHRVRPCDINAAVTLLISRPADFSFPSGHAGVSFAAAAAIYMFNKKWGILAFILAALIGFSRIYLYVHYPSDVLAGAALGALCGVGAGLAVKRFLRRRAGQ